MGYTVITGACGGLGKAFVELLAAQGEKMLLLGRDAARLTALCNEVQASYGVTPLSYALDLTELSQRQAFDRYLTENRLQIKRLINVAGADI